MILLQQLCDAASRAQLAIAHDLWGKGHTGTMQDDPQWMEKIFENALKDPRVDWNTGSDNIQCVLLRRSAPELLKRKGESDIDGRKVKKSST
jgi:hypothetical protein